MKTWWLSKSAVHVDVEVLGELRLYYMCEHLHSVQYYNNIMF